MNEFISFIEAAVSTHSVYFWLFCALSLVILELSSPGLFFFLSFSVGCFVAACSSWIIETLQIQFVIAIIASLIAFFILYHRFIRKKKPALKTNSDALIKQQAIVMQTIHPHTTGQVKVGGEEWSARSLHGVILHPGTAVTIVAIKGNTLIVT